jgi:carboxylesterase
VVGNISLQRLRAIPAHPASDYEEAMEKIAQIHAHEKTVQLHDGCQTTLLTHGHKVDQAIVLMHGMTSCPLQFIEFGTLLHERGYNVFIPRMPYNGHADLNTDDLKYLTAAELRDCCASAVDITHGLGEHVSYAGISVGGVMAAWVAQYRPDVDRAIVISPSFTIDPHLNVTMSRMLMYLLSLSPNIMTQWFRHGQGSPFGYKGFATRGLAVMMHLGFSVYKAALHEKPAVQKLLVVTNAADPVMNNNIIRELVDRWQRNGLRYCEQYEFDASYHLPHDLIGTQNPHQHVSLTYPVLLDLIMRDHNMDTIAR